MLLPHGALTAWLQSSCMIRALRSGARSDPATLFSGELDVKSASIASLQGQCLNSARQAQTIGMDAHLKLTQTLPTLPVYQLSIGPA